MTNISWNGDCLVQTVGANTEELAFLGFDPSTRLFVLWLKDTCGVFGCAYVKGDEFPTEADAKREAIRLTTVTLMHYMWVVKMHGELGGGSEVRNELRRQAFEAAPDGWTFNKYARRTQLLVVLAGVVGFLMGRLLH